MDMETYSVARFPVESEIELGKRGRVRAVGVWAEIAHFTFQQGVKWEDPYVWKLCRIYAEWAHQLRDSYDGIYETLLPSITALQAHPPYMQYCEIQNEVAERAKERRKVRTSERQQRKLAEREHKRALRVWPSRAKPGVFGPALAGLAEDCPFGKPRAVKQYLSWLKMVHFVRRPPHETDLQGPARHLYYLLHRIVWHGERVKLQREICKAIVQLRIATKTEADDTLLEFGVTYLRGVQHRAVRGRNRRIATTNLPGKLLPHWFITEEAHMSLDEIPPHLIRHRHGEEA